VRIKNHESRYVIPAQAGIHMEPYLCARYRFLPFILRSSYGEWIAGMTHSVN